MAALPGDWRLTADDFKDERWYWPVRQLKYLARLPHKHATWLGFGHTIPNGDSAEVYAFVPLNREEMDLKLHKGSDVLLDKFDAHHINDVIDPKRRNVARKRFGIF